MCCFSEPLLRVSSLGARAQIVIAVMHLGRLGLASNTLSVLVAFQVLLLWIKAQYFARCRPHPRQMLSSRARDLKAAACVSSRSLCALSCS